MAGLRPASHEKEVRSARALSTSLLPPLGLFVAAWLPRFASLGSFITWDELMWVHRSVQFAQAVYSGDWASTFRTGHPGVVITWLGALGIGVQRLVLGVPSPAQWTWLAQLPALDPYDSVALQRLAPLLVAAKIPLTLVTAAAIVGCWALLRRLVAPGTALLSALFLALDPFLLALSRVLHLDGLLASFTTLALLSLLLCLLYPGQHRWLLFSAAATGLAALTKTPAVALVPFGALLLLTGGFLPAKRRSVRTLLLWGLVVIGTYVALWPAMWVAPLETIGNTLDKALGYAAEAEESADFFRGVTVSDPGGLFYPVAFLFRAGPVMLLGLLGYPLLWRLKDKRDAWIATVLLGYVVLYGAIMSAGAKKFDRYMLPVFPPLTVMAAMGWARLGKAASGPHRLGRPGNNRQPGRWLLAGGALLVLTQAVLVLPYHPHYLAWYNPLVGGLRQAVHTLPVGWGEGLEKAADYLNARPDADALTVAAGGVPGMAPRFGGRTVPLTPSSLIDADYVVVYVSDRQGQSPLIQQISDSMELQRVISIREVAYAWIYRNETYRPTLELLASEAQASDAVLIAGPSLVARYYDRPWPHAVLRGPESEAEVVSMVQRLMTGRTRIWYVQFPERPSPAAEIAHFVLASEAYRLREQGTLSLYQLAEEERISLTELQEGDGPFVFGEQLQLARYGIADPSIGWGQQLGVSIAWQAIAALDIDYTAFLHLTDQNGFLWGQADVPLRNHTGESTAEWPLGAGTTSRYLLAPWAGTPPGRYEVLAGVYRSDNRQGISARDNQGPLGTTVRLGAVQVVASPQQPTVDDLAIPHQFRRQIGDAVRLLGYNLSPSEVYPGTTLRLDLFWQVTTPPQENYTLSVALGGEEHLLAIPNSSYPSSKWQSGEMLRGQFDISVPADFRAGEYSVQVSLLHSDGTALPPGPLTLGSIELRGRVRRFEAPAISHPLQLRLGDLIELLGYDLPDPTIRPGAPLRLTLYWRAHGPTDAAYSVFAHILGPEGNVLAQRDSSPQGGEAPTTSWLPGEVVVDEYQIPVPWDLPSGPFRVEVGMYDSITGQRLPIYDSAAERLSDDRVLLTWLERG